MSKTKSLPSHLQPDFGSSKVGLPPPPSFRNKFYKYFKLHFMQDGYPGKLENGTLTAHPMYGAYLINDYLYEYNQTKESDYLKAAIKVAEATLYKMEYVKKYDALAFYYTEDTALAYYPGKFISALTQARYMMPFYDLYNLTGGKKFKVAADRIFKSLKIPQSDGGVLIKTSYGIAVEEYPHEIPTLVLNGWTSVILALLNYHEKSGYKKVLNFAMKNISTIEGILNKYDYPQLFLSRYQLTGFAYIKLIFSKPQNARITKFETMVDGKFYGLKDTDNRWNNFLLTKEQDENGFAKKRQLMVNGVFSQINDSQKINIDIECNDIDSVKIYIANGSYEPQLSSMKTQRWILLKHENLKKGLNKIKLDEQNNNFEMIGYPTNFTKKIEDEIFNVYHWLHINNFDGISKYIESSAFYSYGQKWLAYIDEWKRIDTFSNANYSFKNPSFKNPSFKNPSPSPTKTIE